MKRLLQNVDKADYFLKSVLFHYCLGGPSSVLSNKY